MNNMVSGLVAMAVTMGILLLILAIATEIFNGNPLTRPDQEKTIVIEPLEKGICIDIRKKDGITYIKAMKCPTRQ